MTEPIYSYVRGQGWVPRVIEGQEFTLLCGTRVRIEKRLPEAGERYQAVDDTSWVGMDYKLSLDGTGNWIARNRTYYDLSIGPGFPCFGRAFFVVLPVG